MRILLPPSETKRPGGSGAFDPGRLSHADALADARRRVQEALVALSGDPERAIPVLKLGARNAHEAARNLDLAGSGVLPTIERYTGVLYDALDVTSLGPAERAWIDRHVSVHSALFGLIAAGDPIPSYRLSASSRLPGLEPAMKPLWREAHGAIDWQALGWVLDLRSNDYAALAPVPPGHGSTMQIVQRAADGQVRALNHFNKAAKGDLVRRLARSGAEPESADELVAWAVSEGLEMSHDPAAARLTLVTELGAPGAGAKPKAKPGEKPKVAPGAKPIAPPT